MWIVTKLDLCRNTQKSKMITILAMKGGNE